MCALWFKYYNNGKRGSQSELANMQEKKEGWNGSERENFIRVSAKEKRRGTLGIITVRAHRTCRGGKKKKGRGDFVSSYALEKGGNEEGVGGN